ARLSAPSTGRPSASTPAAVTTARTVSTDSVDVASVYARNRGTFSPSPPPGTYDSCVAPPSANGQNHRFVASPYAYAATTPYAASTTTARRPGRARPAGSTARPTSP